MVLLRSGLSLPEGFWTARPLPPVLRYLIVVLALLGNGLTAARLLIDGPDGFGTLDFELLLCAIDLLLWTTVAFAPDRAWVPALLLQGVLVVTGTDPGSFTVEVLILAGVLAYAAGRLSLIVVLTASSAWSIGVALYESSLGAGFASGYLALMTVAVVIGLSLRYQATRQQEDAGTIADFEESIRTALKDQRDELSRELHDIVAHDLTLIAMQSSAGAMQASDGQSKASFEIIGSSARSALNDLRLLLRIMRDPQNREEVEPSPPAIDLVVDLATLAAELEELGHDVTTTSTGDLGTVPDAVRTTVQRLLREGTTNVLKHGADPSTVELSLQISPVELTATVRNSPLPPRPLPTGRRFSPSGFGLIGLRERVTLLGGEFSSGRTDDGHWTLEARIPLVRPS